MLIRRPLHFPLLCALLLCLLASPGGVFGFIWCIGTDGHSHASLRTGPGENCGDPQRALPDDDHGDSGISGGTNPSGNCLHVAITGQIGPAGGRDHLPLDEAPATNSPAALSLSPCICQETAAGHIPGALPRIAASILQHRTIVLLI